MLKKIATQDLRLGMYIHAFCGSWLDHPFWRSRFVVEEAGDLESVRRSAVKELWIDVSKGLDLEEQTPASDVVDTGDAVNDEARVLDMLERDREVVRSREPATMANEMGRAAEVCASAKAAVKAMFTDVRMGKAISPEVARQVVDEINDSVARNAVALISLARLKTADEYTYMHSVAVAALMIALARQLNLSEDEVRSAGLAGLMHDLGKADVPLEILNKPGSLSDAEFEVVRAHPAHGHRRLIDAGVTDADALDVCLHHHEKLDGTGYPHRLLGEQISVMARMGAVCDIYDAVTSNRPYKAGWDPGLSLARMARWTGGHLDERVFQAFVRSLGIYPVGSLVKLSSGRLAVVVEQSATAPLKPVVKTVFSTTSRERVVPETIDLSLPTSRHSIVGREDPQYWRLAGLDELWLPSSEGH
jgi:HD-GYP domain-containing protein (c-di-GMP phosphodiesterase class II)